MRRASMLVFLAVLAPAPLLVAPPAAAQDWDRATETVVRFRGTLRAVKPLKVGDATVSMIGWDDGGQDVAASIAVESVEPNPQVRPGATLELGLRNEDLRKSFGGGTPVGTTRDLELVARAHDGAFWRFTDLRPRSPAQPGTFEGWLEVGMTFRVPVQWDSKQKETVLVESLHLPMHYYGGIKWLNPEAVRQLGPDRPRGFWVFEVVSEDRESLGNNLYRASFNSRFIALEPCVPCDEE